MVVFVKVSAGPAAAVSVTASVSDTGAPVGGVPVSYTHLRAHETPEHLVCRLLLEKKNTMIRNITIHLYIQSCASLAPLNPTTICMLHNYR